MGTDNLWQTGFDFSDAIDDDGVWSYRLTGLGRSENAQQEMVVYSLRDCAVFQLAP